MSDASDAVALAVARTQRLAASRLVRKEEIGAELDKRRRERASLEELPASDEVTALKADLGKRIDALTAELAVVDGELGAARSELAKLKKLAADAPAAAARAVVAAAMAEPDPVLRSPEETALANAREHIADLEAQARVGAELAEAETGRAVPAPDPAAPTKPKKTI